MKVFTIGSFRPQTRPRFSLNAIRGRPRNANGIRSYCADAIASPAGESASNSIKWRSIVRNTTPWKQELIDNRDGRNMVTSRCGFNELARVSMPWIAPYGLGELSVICSPNYGNFMGLQVDILYFRLGAASISMIRFASSSLSTFYHPQFRIGTPVWRSRRSIKLVRRVFNAIKLKPLM